MAKATKTSGYAVEIKSFIAADHADMEALAKVQKAIKDASAILASIGGDGAVSVVPTRR